MSDMLLSQHELRALARARLRLRQAHGTLPGAHPSARAGLSLEFADVRPYQPGDDFRLIDWPVYARLRRLMTRVYRQEVEVPLYLLVDDSASMALGAPPKLSLAARLAAALVFVAYRSHDRFSLHRLFHAVDSSLSPRRGRPALVKAFRALATMEAAGSAPLDHQLVAWASARREPGVCFLFSDFLCPQGYAEGLQALRHRRHQITVVQIMSHEELDPPLLGEVRLLDVETRRSRPLVISRGAWRAYREALTAWNHELDERCRELDIERFLLRSDAPAIETALTLLARRSA